MDRYLPSPLKPKKRFGQNFLQQEKYINELVAAAEISPNDIVLEIGPGLGVITEKLALMAKRVVAVELDCDLIPLLRNNLKGFENVTIINEDILRFLRYHVSIHDSAANKIVGSLPYQITSPLLHQLANISGWEVATFLIQKDMAEKITATPPHSAYLSNFVQAWADVKLVAVVPKGAFFPMPRVDGAIVKMTPKSASWRLDPKSWSTFLHRGFAHPRQMLNKVFPAETLKKAQIDPRRRPATLTVEEWLKVYNLWKN